MLRPKKYDREQEAAEAAERARRLRSGEPLGPLSPLERRALVADYDRALNELARASWLPDPAPDKEPFACEKHPDWRPPRRLPGAPLPPRSHCPYCADEAERRPVGPPVYINGGLPARPLTPIEEQARRTWD